MKVLVTGGAGFIGSALIRFLIGNTGEEVVNVDKLTYAGNLESLNSASEDRRYSFEQVDICDANALERVFSSHQPDIVIHLAAESHVDRSIDGPSEFIQTNIVGTYNLLEAALRYYRELDDERKAGFRFLHVSTDEVFGDLESSEDFFREDTPYMPSSPYSASKASSDHLVRAWQRTFGLPLVITNCSNNYGPYQFPEKLIPHMLLNAIGGKPLPVYGDGSQIRDWLYVDDHARALWQVVVNGRIGETYLIGGCNEWKNIDVVKEICKILGEMDSDYSRLEESIEFVTDRPGHDSRYAIDASKIMDELGWKPEVDFSTGLRQTISWYLDNKEWWERVLDGSYQLGRIGTAR